MWENVVVLGYVLLGFFAFVFVAGGLCWLMICWYAAANEVKRSVDEEETLNK